MVMGILPLLSDTAVTSQALHLDVAQTRGQQQFVL